MHRFVDARYPSQTHELTISVPARHRLGSDDLRSIETGFHEEHERRFAYSLPALPVEILHWRVTGIGRTGDRFEVPFDESAEGSPEVARAGVRQAYFQELGGFVETPVFVHDRVPALAAIEGPAIVDSATTTVVVCPNQRLIAAMEEASSCSSNKAPKTPRVRIGTRADNESPRPRSLAVLCQPLGAVCRCAGSREFRALRNAPAESAGLGQAQRPHGLHPRRA